MKWLALLALVPQLALAQVNTCRPGIDCYAASHTATRTTDGGTDFSMPTGTCLAGDGTRFGKPPVHGLCFNGSSWTLDGQSLSASGWTTVLDCDFTKLPYEPLDGGNIAYTLCGVPWTVINSANSTWPPEVDGGLNLMPNSSAVGGPPDTSVGVTVPLTTLYPSATNATSWRVTWYEDDNLSTDFQFCHLAASDLVTQSAASPTETIAIHNHNSIVTWGAQVITRGSAGSLQTLNPTSSALQSSKIVQLLLPDGAFNAAYSLWLQSDGGTAEWDPQSALGSIYGQQQYLAFTGSSGTGVSPLTGWGIAITAAQNSGSGFLQCQTRRITVEVKP